MKLKLFVLSAVVAISGLSCQQTERRACTTELGVGISPRTQTVTVGADSRSEVKLTSCGGRQVLKDELTWTSADPSVATVDLLGNIHGVAAGRTTIEVAGRHYGRLGAIAVTVVGG